MKKENIELKEITFNDKIFFIWLTKMYGRAEFQFCPVFKRGIMTDLYIYRRQQPQEPEQGYHIDLSKDPHWKIDCFSLESEIYFDKPDTWRNFWCKEHKTISFETYVPSETKFIQFEGFSDNIRIQFRKNGYGDVHFQSKEEDKK